MDVELIAPATEVLAFIDFVHLPDSLEHPCPEDFPAIGSTLDAVVLDFMPSGELRLSACASSLTRQQQRKTTAPKAKTYGTSS
ncbi:hypothetical protein ADL25_04945 [Streptomyces sp. NRRL F-5122]|nr:hypothetical protein ADL25_04945 [Streptomyces sp. NRRL F-5122]